MFYNVLSKLLKEGSGEALNIDNAMSKFARSGIGEDEIVNMTRKGLKELPGYSMADNLNLKHVTSVPGLDVDDLSVKNGGIHDGALFMSRMSDESPKLGSGKEANRYFGTLHERGVVDMTDRDTANYIADYLDFMNKMRKQDDAAGIVNDIRNGFGGGKIGVSEGISDRDGILGRLLENSVLKGKSAVNEDEYLAFSDDLIKDIFGRNKLAHKAPSNSLLEGSLEERVWNASDLSLEELFDMYRRGGGESIIDNDTLESFLRYGDDNARGSARAFFDALERGDKEIDVYRATNKNQGSLRNGDWVTLNKNYADLHNVSNLEGGGHVIRQRVPINHVWWDANDINEFGYDGTSGEDIKNAMKALIMMGGGGGVLSGLLGGQRYE